MRFLIFVFYQTLCIEIKHRFDFHDVINVREASTCSFPVLLPEKHIEQKIDYVNPAQSSSHSFNAS